MIRTLRFLLCATALLSFAPAMANAQDAPARAVVAAIDRARALLDNGDGASARTTMDSLVGVLAGGSVDLAEALHWRAAMAENLSDAERDWKRLLVEAPLSVRAADALLRLSELESLRGQHENSRQHAERLLLDHAQSPGRSRALLLVAKSWFGQDNVTNACTALSELRNGNLAGELKLQSDELQPRCTAAANSAAAAQGNATTTEATKSGSTTDKPPVGATSSTARDSARTPATPATSTSSATGKFSVQLAAYARRADADAMVKRLAAMKITARIDGNAAPFRVRTGRYDTRAQATAALEEYTKRGLKGFVAELSQ